MIAAIVPILLVMPFQRYDAQAITGTGAGMTEDYFYAPEICNSLALRYHSRC